MESKAIIVEVLKPLVGEYLSDDAIANLIEIPSNSEFGDLAFPVFTLAKQFRKAPQVIAQELVEQIEKEQFDNVVATGPYINFFINRKIMSNRIIHEVLENGSNYGSQDLGHGANVTFDMSSPNIAKPMSMGHLRSTVIGNALSNIFAKLNYHSININHLGDWGTQFGKLIVAYRLWGDEEVVKQDPVKELVKLYVEFHEKAELDPSLDDEARAVFKKLEDGDEETVALWQWFKDESLKEFDKVYRLLNIKFDYNTGESFYNDKMQPIVEELEAKGISTIENGATLVMLDDEELPPALIKKSDGATLYLTRDLATAYYRKKTFDFAENVYVVGNEQANHFRQLKAVLKRLGNDWSDDMHHIPFGLITINGRKMSTRKGEIVLLEDVLHEATEIALKQIEVKNPDLPNKEEVASQVGVGAVVFHDLKTDRMNSFNFNLDEIVQFEGETGPYVQYTHARSRSILEKFGKEVDLAKTLELNDNYSWEIVKKLSTYDQTIVQAREKYEPSVIAKYLIQLSQLFNKYYGNTRILDQDDQIEARIALVNAVATVLKDGLGLLGIDAPNKM
ncbi:arginine--tRNA ligase [Vaginisenegalia massiliensis]|uniref:arginine--tRNA ligase n=1 Tax=Vaginisenegalia massiliensis TaxID=2058294 RepID=UPI000F525FF3|nr:arginine--tRNA ligase [Vaginisenegalia massiliensis]